MAFWYFILGGWHMGRWDMGCGHVHYEIGLGVASQVQGISSMDGDLIFFMLYL